MKRISFLISLIAIFVLTTGMTIKETNQATDISLYTNPSGTVTKQAAVDGTTGRWKVNAITNLNGTGAPNFPFGATGITAAVSDFNLNAISHPTLTLGGGYLLMPDGRELATWDGAANNAGNYGGNLSINLTTVAAVSGTTVGNGTAYYLYIDTTGLTSATTADTGRKLYRVQQANLALFTTVPDAINSTRYIYLGSLQTNNSAQFTVIASAATKKSALPVPNISPIVYTLAKQTVGEPGITNNSQGHLSDTDFTTPSTTAYFNLLSTTNQGQAGGNLTNTSVTFTGQGFLNESVANFNGSTSRFSSSNAQFGAAGSASYSFGAWVYVTTGGLTSNCFVASGNDANDRSYQFCLDVTNKPTLLATNTSNNWDFSLTGTQAVTIGKWQHVAWTYDFSTTTARVYVNGQLAGTLASVTNLRAPTGAERVSIGTSVARTQLFNGYMQDVFFAKGQALSAAQIMAIYSHRYAGAYIGAGHVLQTTEWPFTTASKLAFWNFSANANDGSGALSCTGAACNLTNNGTTLFTGTSVQGTANAAALLNGTTQFFSSTNAFFNPGDVDFATGGWCSLNDWQTPSVQNTFIAQWEAGSGNRVYQIQVQTSGAIRFFATPAGTDSSQFVEISNPGFAAGSFHFLGMQYTASTNTVRAYIDGRFVGQFVLTGDLFTSASPVFRVGAGSAGTILMSGRVQDVFFAKALLTDADFRKIYSYRIDHNQNVASDRQLWNATWTRADLFQQNTLENGWLVDEQPNSVYADFNDQDATDYVALRLQDNGVSATAVPVRTFDSGYMTTGGTYTATHGLTETPTAVVVQYESSTGNFENLNPESYCTVSTTTINCDFAGLTVGASNRLRVIASVAPTAIAVAAVSATQAGIVSLGSQQMGTGDKYFSGAIGIGTTSPQSQAKIHIVGDDDTNGNGQIRITTSASARGATINLETVGGKHYAVTSTGTVATYTSAFAVTNLTNNRYELVLDSSGNMIKPAGSVGIGANVPATLAVGIGTRILEVQDSSGGLLALRRGGNEEFSFYPGSNGFFIDASGQATASNNDIVFRSASGNASNTVTEWMRIKGSTGIVQIGTDPTLASNRFVQFPVNGAAQGALIRWDDNSAAVTGLVLQNLQAGGAWANNVKFQFQTTGSNGGTAGTGAIIQALQQQNWTATTTTQDADLVFHTSIDGTTSERARFDNFGFTLSGGGTNVTQYVVTSGGVTTTTACTGFCTGNAPAGLTASSMLCLGGWNDTTKAALNANGSAACTDTSSVSRRCLCSALK